MTGPCAPGKHSGRYTKITTWRYHGTRNQKLFSKIRPTTTRITIVIRRGRHRRVHGVSLPDPAYVHKRHTRTSWITCWQTSSCHSGIVLNARHEYTGIPCGRSVGHAASAVVRKRTVHGSVTLLGGVRMRTRIQPVWVGFSRYVCVRTTAVTRRWRRCTHTSPKHWVIFFLSTLTTLRIWIPQMDMFKLFST